MDEEISKLGENLTVSSVDVQKSRTQFELNRDILVDGGFSEDAIRKVQGAPAGWTEYALKNPSGPARAFARRTVWEDLRPGQPYNDLAARKLLKEAYGKPVRDLGEAMEFFKARKEAAQLPGFDAYKDWLDDRPATPREGMDALRYKSGLNEVESFVSANQGFADEVKRTLLPSPQRFSVGGDFSANGGGLSNSDVYTKKLAALIDALPVEKRGEATTFAANALAARLGATNTESLLVGSGKALASGITAPLDYLRDDSLTQTEAVLRQSAEQAAYAPKPGNWFYNAYTGFLGAVPAVGAAAVATAATGGGALVGAGAMSLWGSGRAWSQRKTEALAEGLTERNADIVAGTGVLVEAAQNLAFAKYALPARGKEAILGNLAKGAPVLFASVGATETSLNILQQSLKPDGEIDYKAAAKRGLDAATATTLAMAPFFLLGAYVPRAAKDAVKKVASPQDVSGADKARILNTFSEASAQEAAAVSSGFDSLFDRKTVIGTNSDGATVYTDGSWKNGDYRAVRMGAGWLIERKGRVGYSDDSLLLKDTIRPEIEKLHDEANYTPGAVEKGRAVLDELKQKLGVSTPEEAKRKAAITFQRLREAETAKERRPGERLQGEEALAKQWEDAIQRAESLVKAAREKQPTEQELLALEQAKPFGLREPVMKKPKLKDTTALENRVVELRARAQESRKPGLKQDLALAEQALSNVEKANKAETKRVEAANSKALEDYAKSKARAIKYLSSLPPEEYPWVKSAEGNLALVKNKAAKIVGGRLTPEDYKVWFGELKRQIAVYENLPFAMEHPEVLSLNPPGDAERILALGPRVSSDVAESRRQAITKLSNDVSEWISGERFSELSQKEQDRLLQESAASHDKERTFWQKIFDEGKMLNLPVILEKYTKNDPRVAELLRNIQDGQNRAFVESQDFVAEVRDVLSKIQKRSDEPVRMKTPNGTPLVLDKETAAWLIVSAEDTPIRSTMASTLFDREQVSMADIYDTFGKLTDKDHIEAMRWFRDKAQRLYEEQGYVRAVLAKEGAPIESPWYYRRNAIDKTTPEAKLSPETGRMFRESEKSPDPMNFEELTNRMLDGIKVKHTKLSGLTLSQMFAGETPAYSAIAARYGVLTAKNISKLVDLYLRPPSLEREALSGIKYASGLLSLSQIVFKPIQMVVQTTSVPLALAEVPNAAKYLGDPGRLLKTANMLRTESAGLIRRWDEQEFNVALSDLKVFFEGKGVIRAGIQRAKDIGAVPIKLGDQAASLTVAAVKYLQAMDDYKLAGLSEKEAHARAVLDAELLVNRTQQTTDPLYRSGWSQAAWARAFLAFTSAPQATFNTLYKAYVNKYGLEATAAYVAGHLAVSFIINALPSALEGEPPDVVKWLGDAASNALYQVSSAVNPLFYWGTQSAATLAAINRTGEVFPGFAIAGRDVSRVWTAIGHFDDNPGAAALTSALTLADFAGLPGSQTLGALETFNNPKASWGDYILKGLGWSNSKLDLKNAKLYSKPKR